MSCGAIRGRFGAVLDGRLRAGERAALEAHLGACAACRGELARWEAASRALRAGGPTAVPAGLAERAFRAALAPRERARPAEEWFVVAARRTLVGGAIAAAAIWLLALAAGPLDRDGGAATAQDPLEVAVLLWAPEVSVDGE